MVALKAFDVVHILPLGDGRISDYDIARCDQDSFCRMQIKYSKMCLRKETFKKSISRKVVTVSTMDNSFQ